MSKVIFDFNEFMSYDFKSISMGLTPSGHLHIGFLSTLACALMYIREHPKTNLIITNIENSLASRLEKYNGLPLRFQYLEDGELIIPATYGDMLKRNSASYKVHNELVNLIWKLRLVFNAKTHAEKKVISESNIPENHKKFLKSKENKIFNFLNSRIHIYSFLSILKTDRSFRNKLLKYLTDFEFAKIVSPLCGINPSIKNFGNVIKYKNKKYQPKCFQIPIRLYCPDCNHLCPEWAKVVVGHPELGVPHLVSLCKNVSGCFRAQMESGYDGYVYHNMKDNLDMTEFHFMLDPIRDFFHPFESDCHIFGGDYFQLKYELSGSSAIDKIVGMFEYMEVNEKKEKAFFGGPLITMEGKKMSKSGEAFNIKDIREITRVFKKIVKLLEQKRSESFPNGVQIEYKEIIDKVA